ncbi:MAG: hypothetical protein WCI54_02030, partial [Bacteroidia bacterium]
MRKFLYIFCLTFVAFQLNGQTLTALNFQNFSSSYKDAADVKAGELNFRFESLGFFWNNEFQGGLVKGYTLPGAYFRPKLSYSPVDDLYLEVGAHMLYYSGRDQMTTAIPWFSARYRFTEHFSVITGNLDQTNQHELMEQLWEPERIYTDKPESGLQFLYSGQKLHAQTWINWEQFIMQNDPFQERFTYGLTANYQAFQNSELTVRLPLQVLMYHQGGEINTNPDGPRPSVQTHANFSLGWEMAMNMGEKVKTINLNGYWLGYDALTKDSNTFPFSQGHAFLIETSAQTKNSRISMSYWNAYQFLAPKGRYLYQSASWDDPTVTQPDRSMLTAKYFLQKNITKGARVAFQVDSNFDLKTSDLSYS